MIIEYSPLSSLPRPKRPFVLIGTRIDEDREVQVFSDSAIDDLLDGDFLFEPWFVLNLCYCPLYGIRDDLYRIAPIERTEDGESVVCRLMRCDPDGGVGLSKTIRIEDFKICLVENQTNRCVGEYSVSI